MTSSRLTEGTILVALWLAAPAWGVVNPALQPGHLYDRYRAVMGLRVKETDPRARTATLAVTHLCKGDFAPKEVVLAAPAGAAPATGEGGAPAPTLAEVLEELVPGQCVVAYVGNVRPRGERQVLFYLGAGQWQSGTVADAARPGRWQWTASLGTEMYGTFTGGADRLLEMMLDRAEGTAYFPALSCVQFRDDMVLAKLDESIRGVALYDMDGDGKLDVYACSQGGDRVFLQKDGLRFQEATKALGVAGLRSRSCSFADVNADGRPDLLADGAIHLGGQTGFLPSRLLPAEAARGLRCSAFVEINGDGWPDVVVARLGEGLAVYLNGGPKGGPFADATAACGLGEKDCGASLTGYFAAGDWNDDGRTDLFFSAGRGFLLIQDVDGRFRPLRTDVAYDFTPGGDGKVVDVIGAGAMAPLWCRDRLAVAVPENSQICLLAEVDGAPRDVSALANETSETTYKQLLTIAEDLNADGYVDLYTTSWSPVTPNTFHLNRGYGSYMRPEKYARDIFPGQAHHKGAWGVAAGDVDGDGVVDLLIGGVDGRLSLVLNDTLRLRVPKEHPTPDDRVQFRMARVTVRVRGRIGVVGAKVAIADAAGRIAAMQTVGSNIATGCRGADAVCLAVREPGPYLVTVRYADGHVRRQAVDLLAGRHESMTIDRDAPVVPPATDGVQRPAAGERRQ